jgi:hypothetical protein
MKFNELCLKEVERFACDGFAQSTVAAHMMMLHSNKNPSRIPLVVGFAVPISET